jgi:uridylate kinase
MLDALASSAPRRVYKCVVQKLSSEALRADGSLDNISPPIVGDIAHQIKTAYQTGLEIGIVGGGGNFRRGRAAAKSLCPDAPSPVSAVSSDGPLPMARPSSCATSSP